MSSTVTEVNPRLRKVTMTVHGATDLKTLRARGLPAERVVLEGYPVAGVRELTERITELMR